MSSLQARNVDKVKYISLILYSLMVYTNYLANALPIGGVTTGEVSDLLDNLFTPTGFTFSIWGIIYLSLFIFLISLFRISENLKLFVGKVLVLFNINCLLNISWIFAWHYMIFHLSLVIMLGLLYNLILISRVIKAYHKELKSSYLYNITSFSFNIYFGWITVATVANSTGLLISLDWGGFGISHNVWTALIIFIATIIASITFIKNKAIWYLLPIIWAFYGIYFKHTNGVLEDVYPLIIYSLLFGMGVLFILLLREIFSMKMKSI
tara:strand:+ start:86 stop:883 length:798 start_codon:yes stop_codon:yes gene_type:complete